jgi:hypothetical protein
MTRCDYMLNVFVGKWLGFHIPHSIGPKFIFMEICVWEHVK